MDRTVITFALPDGEKTEDFAWEDDATTSPDDIDFDSWAPDSPAIQNFLKSSTGSRSFTIVKLDGVPQYKTEYKVKTVARVLGKKIKTKVPVAYRRYATKKIVAVVSYRQSLEAQFVRDVEECGKIAAAAAVAGAVLKGPPGALVAFNGAFQTCILAKLGDKAGQLGTDVRSETEYSKWVPY